MARINFYEKPGCGTNRKQKAMLAAAGHDVVALDLLTEPWTGERLRGFFGDTPQASWFNPASPRIKSGEIDPGRLGADQLIAKMLADPLLIRRPLIEVEDCRCAGFDREPVLSLLGDTEKLADAQGCSRQSASQDARLSPGDAAATPCPAPAKRAESDIVVAYHNRTKHRFTGYAPGPETLDWDSQPNPFREFLGADRVDLELAPKNVAGGQPLSVAALGALLHLSMGLSAWKEFGPDRWALRCNPSSGNLHPTEAYVVALGVAGLGDGLYHYVSRDHALECRRSDETGQKSDTPRLWIGLSSIHWREAWKYGERAFRYCQHDLGHAIGAFSYAADALGWRTRLIDGLDSAAIGRLLGLDRAADFARAEGEEPDLLLEIFPAAQKSEAAPPAIAEGKWAGEANLLDRHPMYRWPIIGEVAEATQGAGVEIEPPDLSLLPARGEREKDAPHLTADIILQRRSAQHFDAKATMPAQAFFSLLDALIVGPQAPWNVWRFRPRLHSILFVHKVEGLEPGVYALPRSDEGEALLKKSLNADFLWEKATEAPAHLPLFRLKPGDARGVARRLFCNQAIASNGCFAMAMLAEFEAPIRENPWFYRQLHWESGLIGQALYLEAEAAGLRGTGVGCFFDDETHEFLGLKSSALQTLYHFTVGVPLTDQRIATQPAYPGKFRAERF
jgi:nitrogenase-associated protein